MLRHSLAQHTRSLAAYLPNGRIFGAKSVHGSNLFQLLEGLCGEILTAEGYLVDLNDKYFPSAESLFLTEWERAFGIPDDCFSVAATAAERAANILTKMAALGVQTAGDFVRLAAIFGKAVDVHPLSAEAFPPYDVPLTPIGFPTARYIIVVSGVDLVAGVPPYDVPFDLQSGESILECVFRRIRPANCGILFRNSN